MFLSRTFLVPFVTVAIFVHLIDGASGKGIRLSNYGEIICDLVSVIGKKLISNTFFCSRLYIGTYLN